MRRLTSSSPAILLLIGLTSPWWASQNRVLGQTQDDLARTAAYAAGLQNSDGGFSGASGQPSTLGSTNSAIKILHYVGGVIPDIFGCIRFVRSCRTDDGGFSQTPGGKSDVVSTAIGLLAVAELRIQDKPTIDRAIAYFHERSKSFEDVRMSIAGLEAVETSSPDFTRWARQIEAMRNPDGTFGNGPGVAFSTGGASAAVLRMGMKLDHRDAVIATLRSGQRADGAWSKDAGPSDLGSSYRIMRALYMLRERPDIDRLIGFITRCRQSDGSYSLAPGAKGNLAATYNAMIITRWIRLLNGERPVVEAAGFVPLFNGKDLEGWEGDSSLWSARDGMLVGHSPGIEHNEFLATRQPYHDFVLSLSFRLIEGKGNSGVQFRSVRVPGTEMSGYQADIGEGYWGSLYDESRRNKVLVKADEKAIKALRKADWNQYVVRARGAEITLTLNGVTSVKYREEDASIPSSGLIALQIHAGAPMEVQFKDLQIQALPTPSTAVDDALSSPGFHLRTLKSADGDRKYSVYVPRDYDGKAPFPVILFLHGSGERGEDGILPTQAGIGPAILNRQAGIPAIVVFPQARKDWKADGKDTAAALKVLDEVSTLYKIDPSRVVLTGLSMGGRGAWDLAAAHPGRFAAVVPICGDGKPEDAFKLKDLPLRGFIGDEDRLKLHLGMRAMVEALSAAGGKPGFTEYRGVGHNSWDRAYNTPELIDWMLARRRP